MRRVRTLSIQRCTIVDGWWFPLVCWRGSTLKWCVPYLPSLPTYVCCLVVCLAYRRFPTLINTVDNIFQQVSSPKIHTFDFLLSHNTRIYGGVANQLFYYPFEPWFQQLCGRNVEVIFLRAYDERAPLTVVPSCVFQCQSLVEFHLGGLDFEFDLPANGISLPNLKKIHLYNLGRCDSHRILARTLFKSCPALEVLVLQFNFTGDDYFVDISAPNLKSLFIMIETKSKGGKFNIDTPKLTHLFIHGHLQNYHFVSIPTELVEAGLLLAESHVHVDDLSDVLGLVKGIQGVTSLCLRGYSSVIFSFLSDLDDKVLPVFRNLSHLTYKMGFGVGVNWTAPLPRCFLSSLKSIVVQEVWAYDEGIKLLEYFLSKAVVLEKLKVSEYGPIRVDEFTASDDLKFCDAVFQLSRSSSCCEVEYSGEYVHATSKSLKHKAHDL